MHVPSHPFTSRVEVSLEERKKPKPNPTISLYSSYKHCLRTTQQFAPSAQDFLSNVILYVQQFHVSELAQQILPAALLKHRHKPLALQNVCLG